MAVTIAISYYYFYTMTRLFTDIFVNVKMDIGGQVYNFSGIFDDEQHVAMSIENLFDNWVYDFLFIPLMYSFWAIIIGSVVSVAAERRSQNRSLSRSTYLLLVLVLFLQIIVYISTSIQFLDAILDIFSFLISAYVALTMVNTALTR